MGWNPDDQKAMWPTTPKTTEKVILKHRLSIISAKDGGFVVVEDGNMNSPFGSSMLFAGGVDECLIYIKQQMAPRPAVNEEAKASLWRTEASLKKLDEMLSKKRWLKKARRQL